MTDAAIALDEQELALARLRQFVEGVFAESGVHDVLDAGCGFSRPIAFASGLRFVGLDSSSEALAKNTYIESGIVGDLETYALPPETFDAVLCWTVLEHLAHPRAAVANMAGTLRPGGLLIVGIPNLWSLKGLVTKLTPHRFHVWVYRRLFGQPLAGTPGHGPYRTYLRRVIAPDRLAELARSESLERIYSETYSVDVGLPRPFGLVWSAAIQLGRVATLGRWDPGASEHVAVYRKVT